MQAVACCRTSCLGRIRSRTRRCAAAMGADPRPVFIDRRAPRLPAAARGIAASHRAVQAAAGALLPADRSGDVRYWYELLGPIHVTFAVCSANGRVLAAIDLDTERGNSRRTQQIKQSVLAACRVRYLRCPVDNLPSVAELQLLVPQSGRRRAARSRRRADPLHQARDTLSSTVAAARRAHRAVAGLDACSRIRSSRPTAAPMRSATASSPRLSSALRAAFGRRQRAERAFASRRTTVGVVVDARRASAGDAAERRERRRATMRAMTAPPPTLGAETPYRRPDARSACSTRSTPSACAATAG